MPSPFPGMNPYLEREPPFHDFHHSLITGLRNALTPQVRPKYSVTVESHVYLHELGADERRLFAKPDVPVTGGSRGAVLAGSAVGAVPRPLAGVVPMPVDVVREGYLLIRDNAAREVVAAIELLSPTNKRPGGDREQYLAKRREYLRGGVHLVEIDLLRGLPRMPAEGLPPCDYVVLVSRAERRPDVDLFPVGLRERLPIVPVPLRAPDPDAVLDLQTVLDAVYDAAGYEDYIYLSEPEPPLAEGDVGWAKELIPSSGR